MPFPRVLSIVQEFNDASNFGDMPFLCPAHDARQLQDGKTNPRVSDLSVGCEIGHRAHARTCSGIHLLRTIVEGNFQLGWCRTFQVGEVVDTESLGDCVHVARLGDAHSALPFVVVDVKSVVLAERPFIHFETKIDVVEVFPVSDFAREPIQELVDNLALPDSKRESFLSLFLTLIDAFWQSEQIQR